MYKPKVEIKRIRELMEHMDVNSAQDIANKEVIMNDLERITSIEELKDIIVFLVNNSNIRIL